MSTLLETFEKAGLLDDQPKKVGRPKGKPTKVITFRVNVEHEQAIRNAVKAEKKRLKGYS